MECKCNRYQQYGCCYHAGYAKFKKLLEPLKYPNQSGPVLGEIVHERQNQLEKWGDQLHDPAIWISILAEEFGETAQAVNDGNLLQYRSEMIQTAAVAVAAIEAIDKRGDLNYHAG